jgi:hypothetical protein
MKRIGFDLQVCAARLPWETRFQELIDFRNVHGHTRVPRSSGTLGNWVNFQQQEFRLRNQGKRSSLTDCRCWKLGSIGFYFNRPTPGWDVRFQELLHFRNVYGHTNVPHRSGPLSGWVEHQRSGFRLLAKGKPSFLTTEKRRKLESIGLIFKIQPRVSWET